VQFDIPARRIIGPAGELPVFPGRRGRRASRSGEACIRCRKPFRRSEAPAGSPAHRTARSTYCSGVCATSWGKSRFDRLLTPARLTATTRSRGRPRLSSFLGTMNSTKPTSLKGFRSLPERKRTGISKISFPAFPFSRVDGREFQDYVSVRRAQFRVKRARSP
jgi:hypothetical protein